MPITTRYRKPALTEQKLKDLVAGANGRCGAGVKIQRVESEFCFYVESAVGAILEGLTWLLSETFEPESYGESSFLKEVGIQKTGVALALRDALGAVGCASTHAT